MTEQPITRPNWRSMQERPDTLQEVYAVDLEKSICRWIYTPELDKVWIRDFVAWIPYKELLPENMR